MRFWIPDFGFWITIKNQKSIIHNRFVSSRATRAVFHCAPAGYPGGSQVVVVVPRPSVIGHSRGTVFHLPSVAGISLDCNEKPPFANYAYYNKQYWIIEEH